MNYPTAYHVVEFRCADAGAALRSMVIAIFYACLPNAGQLRVKQ